MSISVTCPGCGKKLKAKDALAGRTAPCPACGVKLVIGSADDIAAALLRDEEGGGPPEAAPPRPPDDSAEREVTSEAPRRTSAQTMRGKPARPTPLQSLPPLTAKEPPLWLRHLHWLLMLSLIPLAVSLLQTQEDKDLDSRVIETIAAAPDEARPRIVQALSDAQDAQDDKDPLEKLFSVLPGHRLLGAWLPRDSLMHWLLTAGAALLFFLFLAALCTEGSARPQHLLLVGVFTSTIGILFLFIVQALAAWSQHFIVLPTSIPGLVFYVFWLIGFSYRAANDPDSSFFGSLLGFTFGVGLCEELCKALPLIVRYSRPNDQSWRGAYLWGLASGAGFGLAEAVIYAGGYYNGISGAGVYFVRNISCVALHALWTGSAAIMIHRRQHWFQEEKRWYDWIVRSLAVVAVPMVLHGLYDTLLKKEDNAGALLVALASFGWLAFQISRLRGADDQQANADMLREYQRRRRAMGAR